MGQMSRMTTKILLGFALVVLFAIGLARAMDVSLTEDRVSRFLASFAEMRIIAMSEGLKAGADQEASKNPVGAVVKAIMSSKLKTEAGEIAVKHGFEDAKDWATTGRAIAQAYLYISAGSSRGAAKATLDKNKDNISKQIDKIGLLSGKQKQKLKDNLDEASDQLSKEPPQENVAIVRQMKPAIDGAVKIGLN